MTERKPFGMSFETWIDRAVEEARRRGDFDNLPGAGKPIPGLDRPWSLDQWLREFAKREGVSLLPAGLELRRHVEREVERIMTLGAEAGVRKAVAALNGHIREVNRNLREGPASLVRPLDADEVARAWREKVRADSGP
jgi:hypothetical protein